MFEVQVEPRDIASRLVLPMGGQHFDEIVPFCEWVMSRGRPKRIMEIGAGYGGTTELLGTLATELILSVDLPSGATSGLDLPGCRARNNRLFEIHSHFRGVLGDSQDHDTLLTVANILGDSRLDVLFIDGDHHEAAVRKDFQLYFPFVKPGGIIAFHDINSDAYEFDGVEVHLFWRKLKGIWVHTGEPVDMREFSVGAAWGGIGAFVK